jgi:ABC-type phosphate transport system substrate-binding protein
MKLHRMRLVLAATVLLGLGAASAAAAADDVAVIVNKSNPVQSMTMLQLRKIVLGQEPNWPGGKKIAVLMPTPGKPERDGTLRIVCGMNETDFSLHFLRATFSPDAGDPPKSIGSGTQLRALVAGTANAVGFIKTSDLDASVKIVMIDGSGPGQPTYKLKLK